MVKALYPFCCITSCYNKSENIDNWMLLRVFLQCFLGLIFICIHIPNPICLIWSMIVPPWYFVPITSTTPPLFSIYCFIITGVHPFIGISFMTTTITFQYYDTSFDFPFPLQTALCSIFQTPFRCNISNEKNM